MRRVAAPGARLVAVGAAGVVVACASMQAPPGGPEDPTAPEIVSVSPESGSVRFRGRTVEFRFDEVISDRGTGAAGLPQLVLISPRDGAPRVSWRRNALAVRPRAGWRPNTAYSVTVLPGIADLRGNTTKEGRTVVFTTGGELPRFALRGRVFDWMAERPAARAWIEAISRPDSVVYVGVADSSGAFAVGPLPVGAYTLRAFMDPNGNRALDRGEPWDSIAAPPPRPGVQTTFELLAAPRDTIPPRISGLTLVDSLTLTVEFDRPLQPDQPFAPAMFAVLRADSTRVTVREALPRREFERAEEARRARDDSARRDTVGRDTARRDTGRRETARRDTARRDTARSDTARRAPTRPQVARAASPAQAKPSLPPPPTQVVLRLGAPLAAGSSYRVTASGVRNLLRRAGTSSRVLQVPRPAPPDTTRQRPPP